MKTPGQKFVIFLTLALMWGASTGWAQSPVRPLPVGSRLPAFELKDSIGKTFSSETFAESKVLVVYFFGTECPIAKLQSVRLQGHFEKHQSKGIAIVGIASNQQDSIKDIAAYAKTNKITFPLLRDPGNKLADAMGAVRTPEVFVFDAERQLRYRGAIDDQYTYGLQRPRADNDYLVDAVTSILAGEDVKTTTTESVGCHIGRKMKPDVSSPVTFSKQISRLLQSNCVSCHREGEVAPFALTDYDEVAGWAEMIREVVNDKRMPPWHADPAHGTFANDASLSSGEIELINQWVDAGAPEGDASEMPEPKTFAEGWQIGEPDLVVAMSEEPFVVPATGTVPYINFVVDPGFKEDKWIKAAECRMGNRAVVHHIIVATDGGNHRVHGNVDSEWITATAPGAPPLVLPEGYAKLIPAGSKLVFQMHYTPVGTPQEDISKVGFIFADPSEVVKSVGTRQAINEEIEIPPGEASHKEVAMFRFDKDSLILSMFPHMHLRGKAFKYEVRYPDGKKEVLLDIPKYDFNWQNGYKLAKPMRIPKGSVMKCTAVYDNSDGNLANPNSKRTVRWGDQTWDEMMIGYFDMAIEDQDLRTDRK